MNSNKKIILFIALAILFCSCHRHSKKPVYIPDEPVKRSQEYNLPKIKPKLLELDEVEIAEDPCKGLTKLE